MNDPIFKSVRVACTVERAFELFTAHVDAWWPKSHKKPGAEVRIDPDVGGRFYQRLPDGSEQEMGTVLVWEPPHLLAYSWIPGATAGRTEVEVRFTEEGDHTLVEVTHSEAGSGLGAEWPKRAEKFERGWSEVLPAFEEAARER